MRVYLDNAATTQLLPEVFEAMRPYFLAQYGNPGGFHAFSRVAHRAIDDARAAVASRLGAKPDELVFTGGGSEGDNLILRGAVSRGAHVITSAIEHPAVLETLFALRRAGDISLSVLPVDRFGRVDPDAVAAAILPETQLVSVMLANNEVGTIEPIRRIADVCHARGVLLHTDAVQAVGQVPVDVNALGCDYLTLAAHKFHGPKGVGAAYIRAGAPMRALITGGEQERKRRAGTENVPGIVGMAKALELAAAGLAENAARMTALRNRLIAGVSKTGAALSGHPTERLPNNAHFVFDGVRSETLLMRLDMAGIAASAGSACTAGSLEPSHVLLAMGYSPEQARCALRLTLSPLTTEAEIDETVAVLGRISI